jgi:hypothetical protein
MPGERSYEEVDDLVQLALEYCTLRQRYRDAVDAGGAAAIETQELLSALLQLEQRMKLLDSADELKRQHGRKRSHCIVMLHPRRKKVYER